MRVTVSISDPWDLGEALGWSRLRGELLRTQNAQHRERALIRLDDAILWEGTSWRYLIAQARHVEPDIHAIFGGAEVPAGFVGITDEQATSNTQLDTSKWRGGGLVITGTLALENKKMGN